MTTTIVWHDATKELPENTGTYLVITRANFVMTIDYSAKHKLFNCQDWDTEQGALETTFPPKYWAILPNFDEVQNG